MSFIDKGFLMNANLDTREVKNVEGRSISFYNTDKNISSLYMKLKFAQKGEPQRELQIDEVAGYRINITAIKPKTNQYRIVEGILTDDLVDETCAIWKFELDEEFTNQIGPVTCWTKIIDGDKVLNMNSFTYDVNADGLTGLNEEIVTDKDLPILEELIGKVQKVNNINDIKVSETETYSNKKIEEKFSGVDAQFNTIAIEKANQSDLNLQKTRIDNLATLSEGSTTGDAELLDARVGADGKTYTNIGDSIRGQVREINDDLGGYYFTLTDGVFINSFGDTSNDASFSSTDFIEIDTTIGVRLLTYVGNDASRHAFYDSDKKFISAENDFDKRVLTLLTIPTGAKYIRVSTYKNQKNLLKIRPNVMIKNVSKIGEKVDNNTVQVGNLNYTKQVNFKFSNLNITDGIYITRITGQEGNYAPDTYSCATDYIEVIPNNYLKMSNLYLSSNRTVAMYDVNKKTISVLTTQSSNKTELIIKIPPNVRYIRATGKSGISPVFEYMNITTDKQVDEFKKTNGYTNMYANATLKPVISIIDDDTAGMDVVTELKVLCDTLGIKISFAGLTSNICDASYNGVFIDLLLQYEREGFPIIMHGHTQGIFYRKADRNIAQAESDLVQGLQNMHKHGFTDYKACWVTPFGEYDEELKTLAKKWGFESLIRYTAEEKVENPYSLTPNQRYQLYRYTFESENNLAKLKEITDKAVDCNGWFCVGVHSAYPSCRTQAFKTAFAEFISYAKSKGCEVRTINEELRRRMPIYNNYELY